jgi:hypothetical protein
MSLYPIYDVYEEGMWRITLTDYERPICAAIKLVKINITD